MAKSSHTSRASTQERFNWGYWDGRADQEKGKWPMWNKTAVFQCRHPFDQAYSKGYWKGRYEAEQGEVVR